MTSEQAFEIMSKVAEAANKNGVLTINDAVNVKYALDTLNIAIKTASQTYEMVKEELVETPIKSKK